MRLDQTTYGFSRPDAEELVDLIGGRDREYPEIRPRPRRSGASIQYTIDSLATAGPTSPYAGLVVATVTVTVAPCGRSSLIGESIEVVDHSGCIFDLPEEDLSGVYGWATEGIAQSLESGASPGDLTPCHWSATNRCCTEADTGGGE